MSSFFFSTPVDIDIVLEDTDDRQTVDVKLDKNRREKAPLYMDGESVKGAVTIRPKDGRRLEHTGIKVQFIGLIGTRSLKPTSSKSPSYLWLEMFFDRGNHYEFLSLGSELAAPGELQHPQTFPFNFKNVEKQYESYNGINVKLRYFVRVTVSRRMADVIREKDIWVYSYRIPPEINSSIKMDVGIEDCLHIEFEYSKSKYHLKDVIVGRIYFLLVRLKIKHMELSIIRRETTGAAPNQYNESETLVRFEVSTPTSLTSCHITNKYPPDNGRLPLPRRNNPHPPLPRRLRPHPDLPRSQQKVQCALLPVPRPHRRRRTEIFQAE
jgi:vacuolar protein sorting-associated protein 26